MQPYIYEGESISTPNGLGGVQEPSKNATLAYTTNGEDAGQGPIGRYGVVALDARASIAAHLITDTPPATTGSARRERFGARKVRKPMGRRLSEWSETSRESQR